MGDHILPGGGVDDAVDLMHLVVADHVADGRGHGHDLKSRNQRARFCGNQLLGDARPSVPMGELDCDLALLGGIKNVNDTADSVCRADGMQTRQHQMAGFRRGHGGLDCLESRISPRRITSGL